MDANDFFEMMKYHFIRRKKMTIDEVNENNDQMPSVFR
jgi:hypothetical protein